MHYIIKQSGESRSFPAGEPFLQNASDAADVIIHLGTPYVADASRRAILIELHTECLGEHTGESAGTEGANVLGFARYRNGTDQPSNLIELVKQPNTQVDAIAAARDVFEAAGFEVALCADHPGRIIDRLVRPKYNDALRFLDEGLATAADMDLTCRMGLGYPDGPIERVERGGLEYHFDVCDALTAVLPGDAYKPARRAHVAKARARLGNAS